MPLPPPPTTMVVERSTKGIRYQADFSHLSDFIAAFNIHMQSPFGDFVPIAITFRTQRILESRRKY